MVDNFFKCEPGLLSVVKAVLGFFNVARNYMINNINAAQSLFRGFASVYKD